MKFTRFSFFIVCFMIGSYSGVAQDIYMKVMNGFTQIDGESTATNFLHWTAIGAFNAGSTSQSGFTSGGGGGGAIAIPKCFTISMLQDKMAYYLKRKLFQGSIMTSIQLDFTKPTSTTPVIYYRVEMENVYVTAIEEALTAGDTRVTMNVSFTPARFRYTYWPQNSNGTLGTPVMFGWDVTTNAIW